MPLRLVDLLLALLNQLVDSRIFVPDDAFGIIAFVGREVEAGLDVIIPCKNRNVMLAFLDFIN
ncbi:hypothetical protein D3C84_1117640 [compost metagenome]